MNKSGLNLYIVCLMLLIMECAFSWFTISLLHGYLTIVSLVMYVSFIVLYKDKKPLPFYAILIYLFICLGGLLSCKLEPIMTVITFVSRLPILTFFMMDEQDLKNVSHNLNKWFAIIISISIVLYVLVSVGLPIPKLESVSYNQYELDNYWYFYSNAVRYEERFTGFCLEPGYFALLCVCLLSLNKFDLKKKSSIVYVVAILFSMSLEGVLLLFVGLFVTHIASGGNLKNIIRIAVISLSIILILIIVALNYNGGDNVVAENIIERLVFDEELGIVGNNRENEIAGPILDSIFYSGRIWLGIGHDAFFNAIDVKGIDLCSWRVFVCVYGALYTILCFLLTVWGALKTNLKHTITFFIIFWLDFYPHGGIFTEVMYFMIIIYLLNLKTTKQVINNSVQRVSHF